MATKKKATKKSTKKVAKKKVVAKAAAPGLDALADTAKEIAELETGLKVERQKSNFAVMNKKIKVLVIFGSKEKLKIRSRYFGEKERDVQNRTLTLKKPTSSQVLSTARVLVKRSQKKGGE